MRPDDISCCVLGTNAGILSKNMSLSLSCLNLMIENLTLKKLLVVI